MRTDLYRNYSELIRGRCNNFNGPKDIYRCYRQVLEFVLSDSNKQKINKTNIDNSSQYIINNISYAINIVFNYAILMLLSWQKTLAKEISTEIENGKSLDDALKEISKRLPDIIEMNRKNLNYSCMIHGASQIYTIGNHPEAFRNFIEEVIYYAGKYRSKNIRTSSIDIILLADEINRKYLKQDRPTAFYILLKEAENRLNKHKEWNNLDYYNKASKILEEAVNLLEKRKKEILNSIDKFYRFSSSRIS
ncbi:MAG: hypothetical protein ACPLX8_00660 [Nanopusillaceae archaeon]